jgi:hypothetical protein
MFVIALQLWYVTDALKNVEEVLVSTQSNYIVIVPC